MKWQLVGLGYPSGNLSRTIRTLRSVAFSTAVCAVLVLGSAPARAGRVDGPCQWEGGRCHRSLHYALSVEEHQENLNPAAVRLLVRYDMATRIETRTPAALLPVATEPSPVVESLPVAESIQPQSSNPGGLDHVSKPWNHSHYRTLVKLVMEFPSQPWSYVCSGTMIGHHTVLTAGHCVYFQPDSGDPYPAEFASKITVYPAMDGISTEGYKTPYGEIATKGITTTSWWADNKDFDGDWAILQLHENAGDHTGWPQIEWSKTYSGMVNYGGYPADEGYSGVDLYHGSGSILSMGEFLLCHNGYTTGGLSGGATWGYYSATEERFLVANHSFQYLGTNTHCAVRYSNWAEGERLESEAEAVAPLSPFWTCSLSDYADDDGCDCDCGLWDPDCDETPANLFGCEYDNSYCAAAGLCACSSDTCSSLGKSCGSGWGDGCGGSLSCGTCTSHPNSYCSTSGQCECILDTCEGLGRECGSASDGCGGSLSCGTCTAHPNSSCSTSGQCDCISDTCVALDMACGSLEDDGCGQALECGACPQPINAPGATPGAPSDDTETLPSGFPVGVDLLSDGGGSGGCSAAPLDRSTTGLAAFLPLLLVTLVWVVRLLQCRADAPALQEHSQPRYSESAPSGLVAGSSPFAVGKTAERSGTTACTLP